MSNLTNFFIFANATSKNAPVEVPKIKGFVNIMLNGTLFKILNVAL